MGINFYKNLNEWFDQQPRFKIERKNMICKCGRDVNFVAGTGTCGWNCEKCDKRYYNCGCSNIKNIPKITYFDGDRELYSHNLDANKVVIDGKEVWKKESISFNVDDWVKHNLYGIGQVLVPGNPYTSVYFIELKVSPSVVLTKELTKIEKPFSLSDYLLIKEGTKKHNDRFISDLLGDSIYYYLTNSKYVWKKENTDFNVGDWVEHTDYGIGKILIPDMDNNGIYTRVKFDGRNELWADVFTANLVKIDNKFEVGNYVRVINNRSSDYQKCGKIIGYFNNEYLIEFSDFASFRHNKIGNWLPNSEGLGHYFWYKNEDLERVK